MAKRTAKGATALSVSTPAEVDNLLEALSQASDSGGVLEGELLYAVERLVVSPTTGVFEPFDQLDDQAPIERGQVIGTVGGTEVKSAFAGSLQGLLALAGERVTHLAAPGLAPNEHGRRTMTQGPWGLKLTGVGAALPEKVLTNADLTAWMDTTDEWIRERTGIGERPHRRVDLGPGHPGGPARPE